MSQPPIVLYDDARARLFEPFASSRPLGEMRAGALLIRERWATMLGAPVDAFVAAESLRSFAEFDAPPFVAGDASSELPAGSIIVNARALPHLRGRSAVRAHTLASAWRIDEYLAAVRLREPLALRTLFDGTLTLEGLVADSESTAIEGVWLHEVWDLIRHLSPLLCADIPVLAADLVCQAQDDDGASARGPVVVGAHPLWIEPGAIVEPFTVFDTTLGPVLLRRGAIVQSFTRIIGPCFVGSNSVVTADRISGSSIGEMCRVHGELSATIFIGYANKGHDGFVGHSIIGRWVNLGAGTVTSNLKNTYGTVALWTPDGVRDTGLQFLGTLFGDHAKTGIGMRLNTGSVLGAGANVMGDMPPKYVAPFSWGTGAPYDRFAVDKFLETAERMMARRQVTLDAQQRAHWQAMHARY